MAQRSHQKGGVLSTEALAQQVSQVGTMEAGNVFVGIAQLELCQNVVAHMARRARGESGNGAIRKLAAQPAQLPVLGTELMSPFRNTVGLVDREERNRHLLQPSEGVGAL